MEPQITEWLALIVRWMHLIFGAAWIGASFYFNWLNNHVRRSADGRPGVAGDLWAIHGGHFYEVAKYENAPGQLPQTLHWFKWEAYFTWITGITLLVLVYYLQASTFMVDRAVMDLSPGAAIGIGVGTLVVGWIVYDLLCRSPLGRTGAPFAAVGFALASATAYGLSQTLGSRAAYIHVGAMLGTLMALNVFFVIIPNQRKAVAAMVAGQVPDPRLGQGAAQRSLHNNYMTLPVLFIMVSNHYPMTYGHEHGWLVLVALGAIGGVVRHWFNLKGQGVRKDWLLPLAAAGMVALILASAPRRSAYADTPVAFSTVRSILEARCQKCHSATPTWPGILTAPQGVTYDTVDDIARYAARINAQVSTNVMPLGNVTQMTDDERDLIAAWFAQGAKTVDLAPAPTPAP